MKVIVACEFSGEVREAFRIRGHDAWSYDLVDSADKSFYHVKDNLLDHLEDDEWDLLIACPPYTYLGNSGVRCLHTGEGGKQKMKDAAKFFNKLKKSKIPKICIENPIPHKYAKQHIGDYSQIIHPWQYGHSEQKATCLWLQGLPPLQPTNNVYKAMKQKAVRERNRVCQITATPKRSQNKSITYHGIAMAMAEQWGKLDC